MGRPNMGRLRTVGFEVAHCAWRLFGKRPNLPTFGSPARPRRMRNVQFIDGARNATFSIFQATEEEYSQIFPDGRDMELIEDLIERLGEGEVARLLNPLWDRPIPKRGAMGLHGTLFYDIENRRVPPSKREIDWDEHSINSA